MVLIKKVAILQSTYLPWMGFFEIMKSADLFCVFDDVQFNYRSWQQRNRIKGPQGEIMLTVPVKHVQGQLLMDVEIEESQPWRRKHWKSLLHCYQRADYFYNYCSFFKKVYDDREITSLLALNMRVIELFISEFEIDTEWHCSSQLVYNRQAGKTEKLIGICEALGADSYYEPQGGSAFIEREKFKEAGIELVFQNYIPRPYRQRFGEFLPFMSAVDCLFNMGPETKEYVDGYVDRY